MKETKPKENPLVRSLKVAFRKYFLFGLIVLLPFFVTLQFLLFFINYLDSLFAIKNGRFLYVLPESIHPDNIFQVHVPGLGLVFTLLIVLGVGMLSRNYFGNLLIRTGDNIIGRIPLARTIYISVREILKTYASRSNQRFTKVVMIEYPRKGLYTLAFVTGEGTGEVQKKPNKRFLNLFVPTSPNPTSGFYIMTPESEATELEMSIEDAFKLIVSGGMVNPEQKNDREIA